MSKLFKSLSLLMTLALGLSLNLASPSNTTSPEQPSTNFVNLTPNYVQDLNIQPSFDPADYAQAYDVLTAQRGQQTFKTDHIRFVGLTNFEFKTDLLFTIKDPVSGSTLVFITMPDENPVLSLQGLNGDEAELLSANIIECDSYNEPEDQINPCVWDDTIRF